MYAKEDAESQEYYKSQGNINRDDAYKIWKERNPNASYKRKQAAEYIYKYHMDHKGLLAKPEDFG